MNKHIINRIIEYFKDSIDIFDRCIEQLDDSNYYLGDERYYSMGDFDVVCYGMTALEIADRVYGGYDEHSHAVFNPNRKYFRLNDNGVFVSSIEKDYTSYLDESTIIKMYQYRTDIPEIYEHDDLLELFNELDA